MAQAAKTNGAEKAVRSAQANGSGEDVREQVAALQNDVAELSKALSSYGRARGEEAKLAAEQTAQDLKHRAQLLGEEAETQLRTGYAQAETTVRENPAAAVGIAAGVGFVLGLITSRR